jgi:hypothetical protein
MKTEVIKFYFTFTDEGLVETQSDNTTFLPVVSLKMEPELFYSISLYFTRLYLGNTPYPYISDVCVVCSAKSERVELSEHAVQLSSVLNLGQSVAAERLAPLLRILEALGLSFGRKTGYTEIYRCFPQSLQANAGIMP